MKTSLRKKQKAVVVDYIDEGTTLQSIIDKATALGVTDLSKVIFACEYVSGCCGNHGEGEYCYCESGYNDLRFVLKSEDS